MRVKVRVRARVRVRVRGRGRGRVRGRGRIRGRGSSCSMMRRFLTPFFSPRSRRSCNVFRSSSHLARGRVQVRVGPHGPRRTLLGLG